MRRAIFERPPFDQYRAMAARLRTLKGKAMVSLNDHPDIRQAFDGLPMESVEIKYTISAAAPVDRRELVIFSWDHQAGDLFSI